MIIRRGRQERGGMKGRNKMLEKKWHYKKKNNVSGKIKLYLTTHSDYDIILQRLRRLQKAF